MRVTAKGVATAGLLVVVVLLAGCRSGVANYIVDGDTLDVDGVRVRVQGVDTPERGQCGYAEAKARVAQLVEGQQVVVLNGGGDKLDKYDREIGYVTFNQTDLGTVLLAEGLAHARYDSLDGYDRHSRQDEYRALDASTPNLCE